MDSNSLVAIQEKSHRQTVDSKFHYVVTNNLNEVKILLKRGVNIESRNQPTCTPLHLLSSNCIPKLLLKHGCVYNTVVTEGPYSGYSMLHLAIMHNSKDILTIIDKYKEQFHLVADDGCQPVHLSIIYNNLEFLEILLSKGANVDTKFSRSLFEKHFPHLSWPSDFGDEITIFALSLVTLKNEKLSDLLSNYGAKGNLKNRNNKTLLMFAVENQYLTVVQNLVKRLNKIEINCCDNFGYAAVHYLYRPSQYGKYRYNITESRKHFK